ncbi:hypothetical protein [Granulicella mallensis]|jgi:hypothetical protein|uniref:Threonine/homoserine/homoserine lactone efflux protein n=1 Tax=Granulicella mallensis TaxID=940614 RepID=A0A7W7ZM61_9BACT|nr:hypothetical protein [Granulicella mallensis]MBB5062453.1 threonine/homoserine/homoserine lactone efflux protein [Granulicella mallensis]
MNDKLPKLLDLTPQQLATYQVVQAINLERQRTAMQWLVLGVTLAIVVALTIFIFVLIYNERHWAATTAIGVLDGLFGVCLLKVISSMWPIKIKESSAE